MSFLVGLLQCMMLCFITCYYIYIFLNSHKRRLSDGSRFVAFTTVILKIRRLSDGIFCRSFDAYVIIRRFSDASICRFCNVFS